MKTVEIIVSPEGKTTVETKGFVGAECQRATKFLEQSLGQRASEKLTNEYYIQQTEQQRLQAGA